MRHSTPNSDFVDISSTIDQKVHIACFHQGQFGAHPLPRSFEGIRALAMLSGAAAGFEAVEALVLFRQGVARRHI